MSDPAAPAWPAEPTEAEILAGLDPGIAAPVRLLREHGVDTTTSCEGGPGHHETEPVIEFDGDEAEARKAWDLLAAHGHKVRLLQRVSWYCPECDEFSEPVWQLIFGEREHSHGPDWATLRSALADAIAYRNTAADCAGCKASECDIDHQHHLDLAASYAALLDEMGGVE